MNKYLHTGIRWLLKFLAFFIIFFAVALTLLRYTTPLLNYKQEYLAHWAERVLKTPVQIGLIKASWRGWQPQLEFENVTIGSRTSKELNLHIQRLAIGIDMFHSLVQQQLLPSRLYINGANVANTISSQKMDKVSQQDMNDIILWLFGQGNVTLSHVNIYWHLDDKRYLPMENLHLEIANDMKQHALVGEFRIPGKPATLIRVVLNNISTPFNLSNFSAEGFVRVHNVHLKKLVHLNVLPISMGDVVIHRGLLDGKIWLFWQEGHLVRTQNLLNIHDVLFNYTPEKELLINKISGNFAWQVDRNGWNFSADQIHVNFNNKNWRESRLSLIKDNNQFQVSIDYLRLQDLPSLMNLPGIPQNIAKLVDDLKPEGEINDLKLNMQLPVRSMSDLQISAKLNELGFSGILDFPSVSGINGVVNLGKDFGQATLKSDHLKILYAKYLEESRQLSDFSLTANWHKNNNVEQWQISQFRLADKNLWINGQGGINFGDGKFQSWNAHANYSIANLKFLSQYIPKHLLAKKLVTWLNQAFDQGALAGDVDVDKEDYRANLHLTDVKFLFNPNWPKLENFNADLELKDHQLVIRNSRAMMLNNLVSPIAATISDMRKPVLFVSAISRTNFESAIPVIMNSPLKIKRDFTVFKVQGPLTLSLGLTIPFDPRPNKTEGKINFQDTKILFTNPWLNVTNLAGILNFTDDSINSNNMTGVFLYKPLSIQVLTRKKPKQGIVIQTKGTLSLTELKKHVANPALNIITGSTPFTTTLAIQGVGDDTKADLVIQTPMTGIAAATLPPPFIKFADEQRPLFVNFRFQAERSTFVRLQYSQLFSAALQLQMNSTEIKSGELHFGEGKAAYQAQPKLLITANLDYVNVPQWQRFFNSFSKTTSTHDSAVLQKIREIQLQIGQIDAFDTSWMNTFLRINSLQDYWQFKIQAKQIAGQIDVPYEPKNLWRVNLDYLMLPKSKNTKNPKKLDIDPNTIPPLDITIRQLHYGANKVGKVVLMASKREHGLTINKFTVNNADVDLSLTGWWLKNQNQSQTFMDAKIQAKNLGNAFTQWGYSDLLADGRGTIILKLNWPDSLFNFSATHLNGDLGFNLIDGRIVKISRDTENELSLGRLITIFSITSLPKRFTLNFNDLTKPGFSYDVLRGSFRFTDGDAATDNFYLNGTVAQVWMKGKVNFSAKNYNLNMRVAPYITSSLPLIVGVAGGPIAGAVTWVADKIIGPDIGKAMGSVYKITGLWQHPKVTKIERYENSHG